MTTQLEQAARLAESLNDAKRDERHFNLAETRYWLDQYKLIAEKAITALHAALEQPAQDEPVARLHISETDTYPDIEVEVLNGATLQPSMSPVNVYTRPQAREPLTGGDERRHIICLCPDCTKPAREPLAWQPSDTAPQDGTKCLVYWGEAYGQPLIGVAARLVSYQGEMLWNGHGGSHNEVTHWMPLPTPPTEAAQNIGEKK